MAAAIVRLGRVLGCPVIRSTHQERECSSFSNLLLREEGIGMHFQAGICLKAINFRRRRGLTSLYDITADFEEE